jgi:glycosyltransferase involved in cell wall biosynthesis
MPQEKLVSVVIPTYKRPEKLERAVKSVQEQTYDNIEIIVVNDDPETDIESEVSVTGENVRFFNHEENRNGAAARNTGIEHAEGDYIAFLDDDDRWKEEKLERQIGQLEEREGYGASYTMSEINYPDKKFVPEYAPEGDIRKEVLLMEVTGSFGSSLVVERDIVEEVDGFDEEFERRQDWEFLLRVLSKTRIASIEDPLLEIDSKYGYGESTEVLIEAMEKYLGKFERLIDSYGFRTSRKIKARHITNVAQSAAYNGEPAIAIEYYLKSVFQWPFQRPKELARTPYYLLNSLT